MMARLLWLLLAAAAAALPPSSWEPRGITGGGAFFSPGFHPTDASIITATTDMGVVFRSSSSGATWESLPFGNIGGSRPAQIRFTTGDTAFGINVRGPSAAGPPGNVASISHDKGHTFMPMDTPAGTKAQTLDTDRTGKRLLLSSSTAVYLSTAEGGSWTAVANRSQGLRLAGEPLFSQSNWTLFSTNHGLTAVSPAGVPSFTPWANMSEGIAGFAAAEDVASGEITCFVLTAPPGILSGGMLIEDIMNSALALYTTTLQPPGIASASFTVQGWSAVTSVSSLVGAGGPLGATHVRMVPDDPSVAYLSGQCAGDCSFGSSTGGYPFVMKLSKPLDSASAAVQPAGWRGEHLLRGNNNTHTGWEGSWGDGPDGDGWSWGGGALSFTVAPGVSAAQPKHRLAFTDDGFIHGSFDGGTTWEALYVAPSQRNPLGVTSPVAQSWEGNGLMDQSSHYICWASAEQVFGAYTDIKGVVSKTGGKTWSFHYTGHKLNTMYRTVTVNATHAEVAAAAAAATGGEPSATIYAATSSVHDMYQSTHLTDKSIDSGDGLVLATVDGGTTWKTVFDFKMPVIWLAEDQKRPGRLYASAIHSKKGGIFVADGVSGAAPATFTKLSPDPPRTQGHPYTVASLPDGALVVSYSGRMDDARHTFYNASGVFYLAADAACLSNPSAPCAWEDRSSVAMSYWTKELAVDPLDPSGDTWFVCVFTDWGATRHDGAAARGGLYRTTDRGLSWSDRLDGEYIQ
jgi:hypothetical protein